MLYLNGRFESPNIQIAHAGRWIGASSGAAAAIAATPTGAVVRRGLIPEVGWVRVQIPAATGPGASGAAAIQAPIEKAALPVGWQKMLSDPAWFVELPVIDEERVLSIVSPPPPTSRGLWYATLALAGGNATNTNENALWEESLHSRSGKVLSFPLMAAYAWNNPPDEGITAVLILRGFPGAPASNVLVGGIRLRYRPVRDNVALYRGDNYCRINNSAGPGDYTVPLCHDNNTTPGPLAGLCRTVTVFNPAASPVSIRVGETGQTASAGPALGTVIAPGQSATFEVSRADMLEVSTVAPIAAPLIIPYAWTSD